MDPGTDTTMRITNSANSLLDPPVEEDGPTNRNNSSSEQKRKMIQQRLPFGRDSIKNLRREEKSSVNSARMLGKQRNRSARGLKDKEQMIEEKVKIEAFVAAFYLFIPQFQKSHQILQCSIDTF